MPDEPIPQPPKPAPLPPVPETPAPVPEAVEISPPISGETASSELQPSPEATADTAAVSPLEPAPLSPSVSPPYSKGESEGNTARQAKGRATRARKTRERLEKLMAFAKTRKQITNDDVQKLLRVSDATATRYLSRLVKEGKLRREGKQKRPIYAPVAQ